MNQTDEMTAFYDEEHANSERTVMMYSHSPKQIAELLTRYSFEPLRNLSFTVFMDRERAKSMPARSYLVRKKIDIPPFIPELI